MAPSVAHVQLLCVVGLSQLAIAGCEPRGVGAPRGGGGGGSRLAGVLDDAERAHRIDVRQTGGASTGLITVTQARRAAAERTL
jgi:hypothetical protein